MHGMLRLLPINSNDMNTRSAKINFHLTKTKEKSWFIKCAAPGRCLFCLCYRTGLVYVMAVKGWKLNLLALATMQIFTYFKSSSISLL
jgi:hypothetical protein